MRNWLLVLREVVWSAVIAAALLAIAVVLAVFVPELRDLAGVLALAGVGTAILATRE